MHPSGHRISCSHKRMWIRDHEKVIFYVVVATRIIIICCGEADNRCEFVLLMSLLVLMLSQSLNPVLRTVMLLPWDSSPFMVTEVFNIKYSQYSAFKTQFTDWSK